MLASEDEDIFAGASPPSSLPSSCLIVSAGVVDDVTEDLKSQLKKIVLQRMAVQPVKVLSIG